MDKHRPDITAWELEAARRREVIAADFGTGQRARPTVGIVVGRSNGVFTRFVVWASAVVDRARDGKAATEEKLPCRPASVGAIKQGG